MSKLKDILNKMTAKTIRSTQATVGALGGNSTVIAKCISYDRQRKLLTIYDPIGKEPQQRFRGDDGDMTKYDTLQGGRTIKVPWQPIDGGEDREDPSTALDEFHMLGVRDLDDVEPEQLYDYIEMLTAFQRINKGTSRFLRMIVDQRKFRNGSGGGINNHWVPQIMVEIQYDMEGWPDSARATRIIETCPVPTQRPTANSVPPGDPMPCTTTPDSQMFFDRARFDSEGDWLLNALGSFKRPSQSSGAPTPTNGDTAIDTTPGEGPSTGGGGGFNNNMPSNIAASPNRPLFTMIGPISVSDQGTPSSADTPGAPPSVGGGLGDSPQSGSITQTGGNTAGGAMTDSTGGSIGNTEVMIADSVMLPVASANAITDPTSSDTWEVSSDPISGSPRANRLRMFGFSTPVGANIVPKGAGHTMPKLQNPINQRHLLGVSHAFKEEGPWITIHASHKGTPIHACSDGIVRFAGFSSLFRCNTIVIEHTHSITSVYTYCYSPSISVRKGQYVHENQIIALLDRTGNDILMRFGIFDNFSPVDPLNYIKGWKRMRKV